MGLPRGALRGKGAQGALKMCNNYLLVSDYELKPKFKKSYQEFWLQKEISARYPSLSGVVKKLLSLHLVLVWTCKFFRNKEMDSRQLNVEI
jgi:hypothetical protein